MAEATVGQDMVWRGAEALRPFLVPVDELEPFPGNPRRGEVKTIRESLRRFGQPKPILVDGRRIIAGHHVRLAAIEEGWTHVAAIPNEFRDEEEARAFLLADNRLSEIGTFDLGDLVEQLRAVAETGLEGTGYTHDDLDDYFAQMSRAYDTLGAGEEPPLLPPIGSVVEMVLLFSQEQHEQLTVWLRALMKDSGAGVSEAVFEAVRAAAQAPA